MRQAEKGFRKGGAVAVGVTGDAAGYVDGFRRRYDPHAARIMSHITLAFAGSLETEQWSRARSAIQKDLRASPPFSIHVADTGLFVQGGFVLWLKPVDEHDELLSLRSVVLQAFPDVAFDRPDDFVPHISIGFFATLESLLAARDVVQRELHPFSFRVASISFLQADEGDIWQCVDTVELGGLKTGASCG
jgi:2'-5' RNA ligase